MTLEVTSQVMEAMIAEAAAAHPRECCGILLGERSVIAALQRADNVHGDPARHFEIDPQALVDAHRAARTGGPQVLGYYHSHPNGLERPSSRDLDMAAHDGAVWAIIAAGGVTFWRLGDAGFSALPYVLSHR